MKKTVVIISAAVLIWLCAPGAGAQERTWTGTSSFIEVPVRVFGGSQFINTLRAEDFELLEDGRPQKIEALLLLNKGQVLRVEASPEVQPDVSRTFYLFFQMTEYSANVEAAIEYLFKEVLVPGDSVTLITPLKPYSLSQQALTAKSRESLTKEMNGLLRKDIQKGAGEYRALVGDLRRMVRSISGAGQTRDRDPESGLEEDSLGLDILLPRYKNNLQRLESLRLVDEKKFLSFADLLKRTSGQKFVFFFYQKEFRPEISPTVLNQLMRENQARDDIMSSLSELFQFYKRDINFNLDRVSQAFSDADVDFNFVFMDNSAKYAFGVTMKEQSEDVFKLFTRLVRVTGGAMDNSQNPGSGFKKTADTAAQYYLLFYTPANPQKDGSFRKIAIRVKDKDYSISHRLGYFAR